MSEKKSISIQHKKNSEKKIGNRLSTSIEITQKKPECFDKKTTFSTITTTTNLQFENILLLYSSSNDDNNKGCHHRHHHHVCLFVCGMCVLHQI